MSERPFYLCGYYENCDLDDESPRIPEWGASLLALGVFSISKDQGKVSLASSATYDRLGGRRLRAIYEMAFSCFDEGDGVEQT